MKPGTVLRAILSSLAFFCLLSGTLGCFAGMFKCAFLSPPRTDVSGQTLHLVGARGVATPFVIVGTSANGNWASPTGFDWIGEDHIPSLVHPRERDWGDSMIRGGVEDSYEIQVTLTVPLSRLGKDYPTMTGAVVGDLELPIVTKGGFENVRQQVHIPVVIDIVSEDVFRKAMSRERDRATYILLASLALFAVGVIAVRLDMRLHPKRA